MKRVVSLCWLLFSLAILYPLAHASGLRLSEPVQSDAASETFGQVIMTPVQAVSLAELFEKEQLPLNQEVVVQAQVGKVCQKKGCFFVAYDGGHSMRVSFKDYGFFVPTDISGRTVTLVGELVAQELSDAQAEHYNRDLGQSTDQAQLGIKAGATVEMVASAVRVPRLQHGG